MDRPETTQRDPHEVFLNEEIDPEELERAVDALKHLRSSLRSSTLRADVQVAIDRIGRIRIIKNARLGELRESA